MKIIGFLLITLALVHIIFPKYFNWNKELKALSLINRQMMTVHTFFIAFTVLIRRSVISDLLVLITLSVENELSRTTRINNSADHFFGRRENNETSKAMIKKSSTCM